MNAASNVRTNARRPFSRPSRFGRLFSVAAAGLALLGLTASRPATADTFTPWTRISNPSNGDCYSDPVTLSRGPGSLDVFVVNSDQSLRHNWMDASGWHEENLGGVCWGKPAAAAPTSYVLDVVVLGSDERLWHKVWNSRDGWYPTQTGFEPLGGDDVFNGYCTGSPTVVSDDPWRVHVFAVGRDDQVLYEKTHTYYFDENTGDFVDYWSKWHYLGGYCTSSPAVVSWGAGRMDAFVRGGNYSLYHKYYTNGAWYPTQTGFEGLGGYLALGKYFGNAPTVTSAGPNILDVCYLGGDARIKRISWRNYYWSGELNVGKPTDIFSDAVPAVISRLDRVEAFALGGNGWSDVKDLASGWGRRYFWSYAVSIGSPFTGVDRKNPAAVSWGPNRTDVFVVGGDRQLHHTSRGR